MRGHAHFTPFGLYWIGWLLAFLIPELYWVFTNGINTLSDQTWALEGLDMSQPFDFPMWSATHWAVAVSVWLLFLWLSIHIPFGLLR
jgi:succinate-acetate transporter protein